MRNFFCPKNGTDFWDNDTRKKSVPIAWKAQNQGKDRMQWNARSQHHEGGKQSLRRSVNNESEGGFTDVMISNEHTIVLDRPICGRI